MNHGADPKLLDALSRAYAAIEPPEASAVRMKPEPAEPLAVPLPQRGDFRCGEKVAFENRCLNTQVGTITRINQRSATIDTGNGHSWRVGFALLRHVVDV